MAAEEPAAMADSPDVLGRLEDLCTSVHLLSKLKHAQSASRGALEGEFSRIGITIPQFLALANIDQNADISSAELARQSFVSPQAMMTIVARLEAAGSITRTPAAHGGRSLTMRLTARGAALLKEARAHAYAIERYVLDVLGEAKYAQLLDSLDRVGDALSEEGTVTTTAPWESYLSDAAVRAGNARARSGT
ncbi:MAG: MarR family transcriptional regulator [Candidatus Elarobacter sp.]